VALPLRELRALPEDVIRELVMTKLALVEIEAASADKLPSQLSGRHGEARSTCPGIGAGPRAAVP